MGLHYKKRVLTSVIIEVYFIHAENKYDGTIQSHKQ